MFTLALVLFCLALIGGFAFEWAIWGGHYHRRYYPLADSLFTLGVLGITVLVFLNLFR